MSFSMAAENYRNNKTDIKSVPDGNKKLLTADTETEKAGKKNISLPKVSSNETARLWLDNFLQEQQKKDSQ